MNVATALIIALVSCLIVLCSYMFSGFYNPLVLGVVTGVIVGDPQLGLQIGSACALMDLGFYTYGGAVTPSYSMGTIFGVVVASQGGDYNQGILVGTVVAMLGSWFDIIQGFLAIPLNHKCDQCAANNDIKGVERWHLLGMPLTIMSTNFIPIFLGLLVIDKYQIILNFIEQYSWIEAGLNAVSCVLPAVGFALLLSYMDIKNYWWAMLVGYVMFAFLGLDTLGLAILGVCVAYVYCFKLKKDGE